ncbi:MAG: phosphoenolpyruvate--protein phosphotransferase [Devosia sp.]|uniref:phosphoenolpyruvate--protein phosphotransferase n=1 Tax=Devosia sp. TaxID=1871048 RepID=UPI002613A10C|nr:phosphoenolpyruvate--protein phosphotransferase [Devosia sp.]MDB5541272.1 phosphoenolpyruvate--protein phosphotransferase [Devosia sp.]
MSQPTTRLDRVTGTVASIGYASGPLFILDGGDGAYAPSGDPAVETKRLRAALARSAAEIAELMAKSNDETAAILEFQIAMIEDDNLSDPAFAAITTGADAATAWTDALLAEVHGYEAAEDAYFAARSADLRDISNRVLRALSGATDRQPPPGAILHARDLTPTQFLSIDWKQGGGIALGAGSSASHVAMLARSRGVPMLVGTGPIAVATGDFVLLDAERGRLDILPDTEARHEFLKASTAHLHLVQAARSHLRDPAVTADGAPVEVLVNIAEPAEADTIDIATCDGIGLMRTEFLFRHGLPDEETQYAAYRRVIEWAAGKPVTIRTVDAGGDKPVPGYTVEETNPFLGLRGIRLSLSRPEIFRVQIRALLRASFTGNVKVMLPMISALSEYTAAMNLFREVSEELNAAGIPHDFPLIGIMVEVPAVAIHPEPFRDVAFFSIGSNDLAQYVMAAGRDNGAVAALNDVRHPAILSLIHHVANYGERYGIPVGLCGDAAGDPAAIPALIASGLRALSVSPAQLPLAKAAIARTRTTDSAE